MIKNPENHPTNSNQGSQPLNPNIDPSQQGGNIIKITDEEKERIANSVIERIKEISANKEGKNQDKIKEKDESGIKPELVAKIIDKLESYSLRSLKYICYIAEDKAMILDSKGGKAIEDKTNLGEESRTGGDLTLTYQQELMKFSHSDKIKPIIPLVDELEEDLEEDYKEQNNIKNGTLGKNKKVYIYQTISMVAFELYNIREAKGEKEEKILKDKPESGELIDEEREQRKIILQGYSYRDLQKLCKEKNISIMKRKSDGKPSGTMSKAEMIEALINLEDLEEEQKFTEGEESKDSAFQQESEERLTEEGKGGEKANSDTEKREGKTESEPKEEKVSKGKKSKDEKEDGRFSRGADEIEADSNRGYKELENEAQEYSHKSKISHGGDEGTQANQPLSENKERGELSDKQPKEEQDLDEVKIREQALRQLSLNDIRILALRLGYRFVDKKNPERSTKKLRRKSELYEEIIGRLSEAEIYNPESEVRGKTHIFAQKRIILEATLRLEEGEERKISLKINGGKTVEMTPQEILDYYTSDTESLQGLGRAKLVKEIAEETDKKFSELKAKNPQTTKSDAYRILRNQYSFLEAQSRLVQKIDTIRRKKLEEQQKVEESKERTKRQISLQKKSPRLPKQSQAKPSEDKTPKSTSKEKSKETESQKREKSIKKEEEVVSGTDEQEIIPSEESETIELEEEKTTEEEKREEEQLKEKAEVETKKETEETGIEAEPEEKSLQEEENLVEYRQQPMNKPEEENMSGEQLSFDVSPPPENPEEEQGSQTQKSQQEERLQEEGSEGEKQEESSGEEQQEEEIPEEEKEEPEAKRDQKQSEIKQAAPKGEEKKKPKGEKEKKFNPEKDIDWENASYEEIHEKLKDKGFIQEAEESESETGYVFTKKASTGIRLKLVDKYIQKKEEEKTQLQSSQTEREREEKLTRLDSELDKWREHKGTLERKKAQEERKKEKEKEKEKRRDKIKEDLKPRLKELGLPEEINFRNLEDVQIALVLLGGELFHRKGKKKGEPLNTLEGRKGIDRLSDYDTLFSDYYEKGLIQEDEKSPTGYSFTDEADAFDRELLIWTYTKSLDERIRELPEGSDERKKLEAERNDWLEKITKNDKTIREWLDFLKKNEVDLEFDISPKQLDTKPETIFDVRIFFMLAQVKEGVKKFRFSEIPSKAELKKKMHKYARTFELIEGEMKNNSPEAPKGELKEEDLPTVDEAPPVVEEGGPPPIGPPGTPEEGKSLEDLEEELKKARTDYAEKLHQRKRKFFTWLKTKLLRLRSYREGLYGEESLQESKEKYESKLHEYIKRRIENYLNGIHEAGMIYIDSEGNEIGNSEEDILQRLTTIEFGLIMEEKEKMSEEEAKIVSGDPGYKFAKLVKKYPLVRAGVGFVLTGIALSSLATGALPLAGVALGARAVWTGLSTTIGTEGLLQFAGEKVSRYRGRMKRLSEEEMKNMSKEELALRLCAFQEHQAKKGESVASLSEKERAKYDSISKGLIEKRREEIRQKIEEGGDLESAKAELLGDYLREQIQSETEAHEQTITRRKKFAYAKWGTAIAAGLVAGILAYMKFGRVPRKEGGEPPPKTSIGPETDKPPTPSVDDQLFYGSVRPGRIGSSTDIIDQQLTQYAQATGQPITLTRGQYSCLRDLVDKQWPHPLDNRLPDGYGQYATGRQLKSLLGHVLSKGSSLDSYPGSNIPLSKWYFAGDSNWLQII